MNFEFGEEQMLLRDQARGFLSDACSADVVRRVLDNGETHAADVWQGIVDMGWTATAIPEEFGGLGLSYLELVVIAEELGRACAPVPFCSSVYLATEALLHAGSQQQKEAWLPKLASGQAIGTLAYAEGAGQTNLSNLKTRHQDGALNGIKPVVADADIADFIVVAAANAENRASLYLVAKDQDGVNCSSVQTVDPTRQHVTVSFNNAQAELLGKDGEGAALMDELLNRAAVLFAWEQVGAAEACLEMAKEYALGRYAFGRPIASYQAIKHKLADMYVKNTLARSNAYFGAWALNTNAAELPLAAATARVAGIQALYFASKENIQTHGGMGYTWEFDCQFYYRRSKILALNIGSEGFWADRLITASDKVEAA